MAEYQSKFTGLEVDNALEKLRTWLSGSVDKTTKPTDGSSTNISSVVIDGNTYAVLWRQAPTASNDVYGIALHANTGRICQVHSANGVYSVITLDENTDTKNTAGATSSPAAQLALVGINNSAVGNAHAQTFVNANVYEQNGNLYATNLYANSKEVATQEWVGQHYTNNAGTITGITMNSNSKGTSGVVDLGNVVTGGTTKYAHPSFSGNSNTTSGPSTTTSTVASSTHKHGITLTSSGTTSSGAIKYLESIGDTTGTTQYAGATFSGNEVSTAAPTESGASVASSTHKHDVGIEFKSADSTAGLSSATAASSVKYLEKITVTPKKMTASFSGTSVATGNPNGTSETVPTSGHTHSVTATGSVTLSASTVQESGPLYVEDFTYENPTPHTVNVASGSHSHGYTPSGTVSLGSNETASGGVVYIEAVTLPAKSTGSNAAPHGHTHNYDKATSVTLASGTTGDVEFVTGITGSAASGSPTENYLKFTPGTTPKSGATPNHTSTNTGNDSGNGQAVASTAHTHSVTINTVTGSNTTHSTKYMKFNAGTTPPASASPGNESKNTGNNSGTNFNAVTGYPNFSGGDATPKYLHFSAGTTPPSSATPGHTSTASGANSGTKVVALTAINAGSGSLESYDAATNGTKQVANGTRIPYIASFNAGTTPPSAATPGHTSTNTGNNSGTKVVALTSINGGSGSLEAYDAASGGTKKVANGTRIPFLTAVATTGSASGTGSGSAAPNEHTHNVTVSGTTGNNSGTKVAAVTEINAGSGSMYGARSTSGTGTAARRTLTISHSHTGASVKTTKDAAPHTHTHSYGSDTALTTTTNSGSAVSTISGVSYTAPTFTTYYLAHSHTAATAGNTGDAAPHTHTHTYDKTTSVSLTAGTAPSAVTYYLAHGHTGASAKTTGDAAPHTHTHNYDKTTSVSLTAGTAPSLVSNDTTTDGIVYIASHTNASLGTASTKSAAPGTHTHTYDKTTSISFTAGTAPSMNFNTGTTTDYSYVSTMTDSTIGQGTTSVSTGAPAAGANSASASTTVASHTHTHTYDKTTSVSLTAGTAPSLTSATTTSDGAISYLKSYSVSGGSWSATKAKMSASLGYTTTASASNSGTAVAAITALTTGSVTPKYFHPSFSGTADSVGAVTSTTPVIDSLSGGGITTKSTKYMTASFSGNAVNTAATTTTTSVAKASHTHNVTATGNITLSDTAASGGIDFVATTTQTQKYFSALADVGDPTDTATVAASGHTHKVTATGSVALALAENSATGKIGVITSITSGTEGAKYLTATTGDPTNTATVASSDHTHTVTPTGTVSLGLDNNTSGTAIITSLDKD